MNLMGMISPLATYGRAIAIGILLLALTSGYLYYRHLKNTIAENETTIHTMSVQAAERDIAISNALNIIKKKEEDNALSASVNTEVTAKWVSSEADKNNLRKRLAEAEKKFRDARLVALKPPVPIGSVEVPPVVDIPAPDNSAPDEVVLAFEKQINQITKDSQRCNELVSGVRKTPDDINNTVCPNLVKNGEGNAQ